MLHAKNIYLILHLTVTRSDRFSQRKPFWFRLKGCLFGALVGYIPGQGTCSALEEAVNRRAHPTAPQPTLILSESSKEKLSRPVVPAGDSAVPGKLLFRSTAGTWPGRGGKD